MYGEKRRRCVVDETENFASPRRTGPFIRNEFRVAAASATTTDPREVHPGAELTLVTTHHRRRPDSTQLSSETVLSSMAKRSMDRRNNSQRAFSTLPPLLFFHRRTPFIIILLLFTKHNFFSFVLL